MTSDTTSEVARGRKLKNYDFTHCDGEWRRIASKKIYFYPFLKCTKIRNVLQGHLSKAENKESSKAESINFQILHKTFKVSKAIRGQSRSIIGVVRKCVITLFFLHFKRATK